MLWQLRTTFSTVTDTTHIYNTVVSQLPCLSYLHTTDSDLKLYSGIVGDDNLFD